MNNAPSVRAQIIEKKTYLRPIDEENEIFETHEQGTDRVIQHQRWLWERAKGGMQRDRNNPDEWYFKKLDMVQEAELDELKELLNANKVSLAGRTHWLGGTRVAKTREASQFNCSGLQVETVHDFVDHYWLLLQGCGVGFVPVPGTLNGFCQIIPNIEIIKSKKTAGSPRGVDHNVETFDKGVWTIKIGDSSVAWAKAFGKIIAGKYRAHTLIIDLSEIRAAGQRMKGYGWICSGDGQLSVALAGICEILNKRAGELLTRIDILDIGNWLGTTLSSRRAAEIAMMLYGDPEWESFAKAKDNLKEKWWRSQSNNSLMFHEQPTSEALMDFLNTMVASGGSEPGFINQMSAMARAAWFKTFNPCAEILLGNKSFCNLVETVLWKFNGDWTGLLRAHYILARANYRQTCVNLRDGVLQSAWHELNEFLRLCGVGVTGVVLWEHQRDAAKWQELRKSAQDGCHSMADELYLPRAKLVTTIKPSGTNSKKSSTVDQECPEGIHRPLGKYVINNVNFGNHDPLLQKCKENGYRTFTNPQDHTTTCVAFPIKYENIDFETMVIDGKEVPVNLESAVSQLERYKFVMEHYVDHNCSITVSYDPSEIPAIHDWLMANWDTYVAVSFIFRNDPTKTAQDLGYAYLPQEVVDEQTYLDVAKDITYFNIEDVKDSFAEIDMGDECASGACPIR